MAVPLLDVSCVMEKDEPRLGSGSARRHPGHRQVVAPRALLHQGLDEVPLPGHQGDLRGLLARIGGPRAVIRRAVDGGDRIAADVRGAGSRREPQLAGVGAGDPKRVIAGRGRIDVPLDDLAVVRVPGVVRGLEGSQVLRVAGIVGVVRVQGRAGQIGDRTARVQARPNLVENLARRRLIRRRDREAPGQRVARGRRQTRHRQRIVVAGGEPCWW